MTKTNAWNSLKRKRWIFVVSIISGVPMGFLSDYAQGITGFWFVIPVVWAGFMLASASSYLMAPCPKCGQSLFYKGYANIFANKCLHCHTTVGDLIEEV